jgi:hypothetical protein
MPLASTVGDVFTGVVALATAGLFVAATAAAIIARNQLRGLNAQLVAQQKTEARRRVSEHRLAFSDRNFVRMQTEAERFLMLAGAGAGDWSQAWAAKKDSEKFRITAAMNFYETLASDYNAPDQGVLDREMANRELAYVASARWVVAKPFVYWLREQFDPRAYVEWEQLHETFALTEGTSGNPAPVAQTQSAPLARAVAAPAPAGAPQQPANQPGAASAPPASGNPRQHAGGQEGCPQDPFVLMPRRVLVVAVVWTLALAAVFSAYVELDAVADFFPTKIGPLPLSAIWFGAIGGLLVSLQGIFAFNHEWRRRFDYWHYMRPALGAIMGTLGCLVFIALSTAASSSKTPTPDATFYAVIALALGYREQSFRELLKRLIDTVILPAEKNKAQTPAEKAQATG